MTQPKPERAPIVLAGRHLEPDRKTPETTMRGAKRGGAYQGYRRKELAGGKR